MRQAIKRFLKGALEQIAPRLGAFGRRYKIVIKYGISGSTAVAVNLSVLYAFTDLFGMWYVASSAIAFCVSLAAGFFLQKFWTFRDRDMRRIKRQLFLYTAVGVLNLALGPVLLYAVVETFGMWYLLGQLLVLAALSVESYLINRFITFKKDELHECVDA